MAFETENRIPPIALGYANAAGRVLFPCLRVINTRRKLTPVIIWRIRGQAAC